MTSCPDVIVALFHNPLSEPFVVLSSGFTFYFYVQIFALSKQQLIICQRQMLYIPTLSFSDSFGYKLLLRFQPCIFL